VAPASYCVIGSGLAGTACARALLREGADVLMIDAGAQCESEKISVARRLAAQEPTQWTPDDVRAIRGDYLNSRGARAFKPVYGSDFPYAKNELASITQDGTKCLVSHAKGGLSNVWGAAVLPSMADDFTDWPFGLDELAPSYAEVGRALAIAGEKDDLARLLPYYAPALAPIQSSRQARMLLDLWRRNRESLKSSGITFGNSRLAVKPQDEGSDRHCRLTGLCLSGCPYSAIYNAQEALAELRKNPRFRYEPGWIAEKIQETGSSAVIQCRSIETGATLSRFEAQRVFVACGALGTAKIILASTEIPAKLTLRYQPYFLLPLLAFSRCTGVDEERLHTLAQGFMEVMDRGISDHLVHLQFYTYNNFIKEKISGVLKFAPEPISKYLGPALWERLLIVQGYLNSQDGGDIVMTAEKSAGGEARLKLSGRLPLRTKWKIARVAAKLLRKSRAVGGLPLLPLMELGVPGEGNHIGSVFPMAARPFGFQSDILGRVKGSRRTHAVDASVLPSLPATTISYTMMANADRIAREAARQDARS